MLRPEGSHFSLTIHARSHSYPPHPLHPSLQLYSVPFAWGVLLPPSVLTLANSFSSFNIQLKTQNHHGHHCLSPSEGAISPFSARYVAVCTVSATVL